MQAFALESVFLIVKYLPVPVAAGKLITTAPAVALQVITESVESTVYGEEALVIVVSFQWACFVVVAAEPAEEVVSPVKAGNCAAGKVPARDVAFSARGVSAQAVEVLSMVTAPAVVILQVVPE